MTKDELIKEHFYKISGHYTYGPIVTVKFYKSDDLPELEGYGMRHNQCDIIVRYIGNSDKNIPELLRFFDSLGDDNSRVKFVKIDDVRREAYQSEVYDLGYQQRCLLEEDERKSMKRYEEQLRKETDIRMKRNGILARVGLFFINLNARIYAKKDE